MAGKFERAPLNEEQRRTLLNFFRKNPPQARRTDPLSIACLNRAAISTKLTASRARYAWLHGWPDLQQPPMREEILREQAAARFMEARQGLVSKLQEEYDAATLDAIEQRGTEAVSAKLLQSMADGAVAEFATTAPALLRHCLGMLVRDRPTTQETARLTMRELTRAAKVVAEIKVMATEHERLVRGEPTEIMGLIGLDAPGDIGSLETEMAAAARAMERAKEEHAGGNGEPTN